MSLQIRQEVRLMYKISPDGVKATFSVDLEAPSFMVLDLLERAVVKAPIYGVLMAAHRIIGPQIGFIHLAVRGDVADVENFRTWIRKETDSDEV